MNQIVVNADLGTQTISRHIYGHFAEHLGRCIYGGFWVGEESDIPHTRGIRNDVVAALRAIQIPNLRWPGGCFADEYHWRDGIGPRNQRPTMINTHWGGVTENNHFGTHEFMDLCSQLACEPYICGNLGSGTVQEMQQWVEYLTFDGTSPMADLRRANGREEPWRIRFWGVGNENWGCGGTMRPEHYADEYRRYQTYVRNYGDNKLYKIACGPRNDDYDWTETMMKRSRSLHGRFVMDAQSLHYYTPDGPYRRQHAATQFSEHEWVDILKTSLYMDELITRHSAIMDQYDPDHKVDLIVDEWGTWYAVEPGTNPGFLYQQNTMRDALVAALTLHIFHRHCDRVTMSNIAQTINVLQALILTEEGSNRMLLTPTYHVFEMYKVHQDATHVPLDVRSEDYTFGELTMPAISATASRNAAGVVHLSLCNVNPHEDVAISCVVRGLQVTALQGRVLTSAAMTAHNTFDEPSLVSPRTFDGATIDGDRLGIVVPAKAIVVLELMTA